MNRFYFIFNMLTFGGTDTDLSHWLSQSPTNSEYRFDNHSFYSGWPDTH